MNSNRLPLEKFEKGKFYQVPPKDAKRIASRIFQIYDKDANKEISLREIKSILRDVYKTLTPKKTFKTEEIQQYFDLLNTKKNKNVTEEDFQRLVNKYFVTYTKDGSLDKQHIDPEMYELNKMHENKNKSLKEVEDFLIKEGNRRFGKEFIQYQMKVCKKLFDDNNNDGDKRVDFDDMCRIFESIYRKIGFLHKSEKFEKNDIYRLLQLINYDQDEKIGYEEFHIFYLKALLGS